MFGVLAVRDFCDSDKWKQARLVVCTILEFTESLSERLEYKSLASEIERLSITVLDTIAEGYERNKNRNLLSKAQRSIDELERQLLLIEHKGGIEKDESHRLKDRLDALKQSLQENEPRIH